MKLLFLSSLILINVAVASSLEEVRLNSKDSITFFTRLQSLSRHVGGNQYKLNFISAGSGFKFVCDASMHNHSVSEASCTAYFDVQLSDPQTTVVAPGKTSNTIFADFKVEADNLKLASIRSGRYSGLGTTESRVLAYLRSRAYDYPRLVINCDKLGEPGRTETLLESNKYSCSAMAIVNCNAKDCGKN